MQPGDRHAKLKPSVHIVMGQESLTSGASFVIARRRIALASRTEGLTKIMDTRYAVIDIQDGKIVAIRKTRRAALILADKKDQAYGMYRYQVKRIENV